MVALERSIREIADHLRRLHADLLARDQAAAERATALATRVETVVVDSAPPPTETDRYAEVLARIERRLEIQARVDEASRSLDRLHMKSLIDEFATGEARSRSHADAKMSAVLASLSEIGRSNEKQDALIQERDRLKTHCAELEKRVASLMNSTSWRITAPLRSLGRMKR